LNIGFDGHASYLL